MPDQLPQSLPRAFFERITTAADPVAAIRKLIDPDAPTFETDWLDFKGEYRGDLKQRDKAIRGQWSEYLSAFANTGGGVLLWGVDARSTEVNGRQLDFAAAEATVRDPVELASKLNGWLGQAVAPPLSGVEIMPYPLPEDASRGFVVSFVPEGRLKPYQSQQTSDRQYYLRGGASNFVMDRAVLASLFHPRREAAFRIRAHVAYGLVPGVSYGTASHDRLTCRISLFNDGNATARQLFVRVRWEVPAHHHGWNAVGGQVWEQSPHRFAFAREHPLHPGLDAEVCVSSWEVPIGVFVVPPVAKNQSAASIEITVFAADQPSQVAFFGFDLQDLRDKVQMRLEATAGAG